jgi:lipoate-protein ligase A
MQRLELSPASPAECLAADEALLDWSEAGQTGETLLFWEPRETFVVVGYANKVASEVNVPACARQGVPVFRRCSGGGTVVQMPGGLNYSLILRITESGPTRNITAANHFIMGKNRAAVQAALGPDSPVVSIRGHTDLAVADGDSAAGRKFSGNAQRRPHEDFVTNLKASAAAVKAALAREWNADVLWTQPPVEAMQRLAREKYATEAWNYKF